MTGREAAELMLARGALGVLRRLGPVGASNALGWLARRLGPLMPASRVADVNLRLAMPGLDRAARRGIVRGVWENLGRTVGELPHLGRLVQGAQDGPGWSVEGMEHLGPVLARGGPAILFSAHMANWEILPAAAAGIGMDLGLFYRAAGHSGIDALINRLRQDAVPRPLRLFPKGTKGARQAVQHLARGGFLGVLIDQKMNDGVAARLFGHPAMSPSAAAALALRLRCPLLPVRIRRLGPARLVVMCEAPLPLPDTGDRAADVLAVTQAMNDRLERWVRADPEAWLWLHRRFDKSLYRPPGAAG